MLKTEFLKTIEGICPSELQEEWDNCGIQVNTECEDVNKVLIALEISDEVIDEAVSLGCDFILTHHPLIFGEISSVDNNIITGRYINRLIKEDISVYSCHTSFDKMDGGNNDDLGRLLGITGISKLNADNGIVRCGKIAGDITLNQLAEKVGKILDIPMKLIRTTGDGDRIISSVAWCTGSGAEYLKEAHDFGMDAFITGDVKYHDAREALGYGICLIDAGHFGTEKIFPQNMHSMLEKALGDSKAQEKAPELTVSEVDLEPFS